MKSKVSDFTCPVCKGQKTMLYKDEDGEYVGPCELCEGTGVFSDEDMSYKFRGRLDFSG